MIQITTYDDKGMILSNRSVENESFISSCLEPGTSGYVLGHFDRENFAILNNAAIRRESQNITLAGNTLAGLIPGCEIHVNGKIYICDETECTVSINLPIDINLLVRKLPHKDWFGVIKNGN